MATRKKVAGRKVAIFDTETTGLPLHRRAPLSKQPRIIEFAAAIYDTATRTVVRECSTLINPGVQIEEVITKITGITNDQLQAYDVPVYAEVAKQIADIFAECDISIAHNHPFDKAMVEFELQRMGAGAGAFAWPELQICTVEHFKPIWGRRPKLTEVYEHVMGKKLEQTHRALDDVHALAEVCLKEEVWA